MKFESSLFRKAGGQQVDDATILKALKERWPTHSFSILRLEGDSVVPRTRIIIDEAYGVEYSYSSLMLGLIKPAAAAAAEACLLEELGARVSEVLIAKGYNC